MSRKSTLFVSNGIGNSLFQIAYSIYLRNRFKTNIKLNFFLTNPSFLTEKILKWVYYKNVIISPKDKLTFLEIIALLILFVKSKLNKSKLINHGFKINLLSNTYHYGYYQELKNILSSLECKEIITRYLPKSFHKEKNYTENSLTIHLRQGDDFSQEEKLQLNYYISAIKNIHELRYKNKFSQLNIIGYSSDVFFKRILDYLLKMGYEENIIHRYSNLSNLSEDFNQIYNATNFISSNSTFAFWASWGKPKNIIFPRSYKNVISYVSDSEKYHKNISFI